MTCHRAGARVAVVALPCRGGCCCRGVSSCRGMYCCHDITLPGQVLLSWHSPGAKAEDVVDKIGLGPCISLLSDLLQEHKLGSVLGNQPKWIRLRSWLSDQEAQKRWRDEQLPMLRKKLEEMNAKNDAATRAAAKAAAGGGGYGGFGGLGAGHFGP